MDNALDRTSDVSREIVARLVERMTTVGNRRRDRIVRRVGRHWVAMRSTREGRVFAEIRPHRKRVEVFILPRPDELSDPRRLAHRAPSTQGWGWFNSHFDLVALADVEGGARLLRQSYLHAIRGANGHASRPRRRRRTQTV